MIAKKLAQVSDELFDEATAAEEEMDLKECKKKRFLSRFLESVTDGFLMLGVICWFVSVFEAIRTTIKGK